MRHSTFAASRPRVTGYGLRLSVAVLSVALGNWGCDTGAPDPEAQRRNTGQVSFFGGGKADFLPEFIPETGEYHPYWSTGELGTPRYFIESLIATNGLVYVMGGSDEQGFTGLDTAEVFDQSTIDRDQAVPDSGTGQWIDTNFEGDPIIMQSGPRLLLTLNALSNNSVVVIGGTANLDAGRVYRQVEIFDPETRTFENLESGMITPRFNHTTVQLNNGTLLIVGGQKSEQVTMQDEDDGGGFGQGQGVGTTTSTVFPSVGEAEVFSPRDGTFSAVQQLGGDDATLNTQRGRSGHAMERLAGPDNLLTSSDDIFVIVGGYQTLSAASENAPESKAPGAIDRGEANGLRSVEVFDPSKNIFTLIASVKLESIRVNTPEAVNLGKFNNLTWDGIRGMSNAFLVTNGNDDGDSGFPLTPLLDQLFVAIYMPQAGPAHGVRFFEVEENRFFSYIQNTEYINPETGIPVPGEQIGRCATNTVTLPRSFRADPGVEPIQTRVFSLAGVDTSAGAFNYDGPAVSAGCVFDPYFSQPAAFIFGLDPTDLETERRNNPQNFLGIVGVWMTIDGMVSSSVDDFGTTPENRWGMTNADRRVFHTCSQLPGVDGVRNTLDDRILLAGGGQSYPDDGGEPTTPSAEIYLPPGSSTQQ